MDEKKNDLAMLLIQQNEILKLNKQIHDTTNSSVPEASYGLKKKSMQNLHPRDLDPENKFLIITSANSCNDKEELQRLSKLELEFIKYKSKNSSLLTFNQDLYTVVLTNLKSITQILEIPCSLPRLNEISDLNIISQQFDAIKLSVNNLLIHLASLQDQISMLSQKNLELPSQSKVFSLTQTTDLEGEIQRIERNLQSEITKSAEKDKKINSQKQKIAQLQQEIKNSFSRIEMLKSQSSINDKNLVLIQKLQGIIKEDSTLKSNLRAQIEKYKKRINELEDNKPQTSNVQIRRDDPNSMLLNKIELMKNELESYCPSESSAQKELRGIRSMIFQVQSYTNRIETVLKNSESDFTCKNCNKLENIEVFACGHCNCLTCNKICRTCSAVSPSLSTNIFYRSARRHFDLKKLIIDLKSLLSQELNLIN